MPQSGPYKRCRIIHYLKRGCSNPHIAELLKDEGLSTSRVTVWRLRKRLEETLSITPSQRPGPHVKLASKLDIIERSMREDDETTAAQLQEKMQDVSLSTIKKARRDLGWTYRTAAYCQLI